MANGSTMPIPKVFIACGGSGLAALDRMCQLLAEDQYWRREAQTSLYFLVIDTDENDLQAFNNTFDTRFGPLAGNITRQSVLLSQGVSDIAYVLDEYFVRPLKEPLNEDGKKAKQRLYRHWWTSGGSPEVPQLEEPLRKGAGQCPPISYFLVWHHFSAVTKAIERIMADIVVKRGGGTQPVVEIYLLAGLAGGTGRGCWMPVAYAMRDYIVRNQIGAPQIRGIFFDYSVLRDVFETSETDEKRRMQINAITGWSELSCWVAQESSRVAQEKFKYSLPSMENPGSELADVLQVELDIRQTTSPIAQIYMMFADCRAAILRDKKDFYSIAGNALYSRLRAESIQRGDINQDKRAYRNMASAIIEVPGSSLRLLFEVESKARLLDQRKDPDLNIEGDVEEFMKQASLAPSKDGAIEFYSSVLDKLYESKASAEQNTLEKAISAKDKTKVGAAIKRIEGIVLQDQDVEKFWTADDELKKMLKKMLSTWNGGSGLSRAQAFAERLAENLGHMLKDLPADKETKKDVRKHVDELATRTLMERITGGSPFNDADRKALYDLARHQFEAVNDEIILRYIRTRIEGLVEALERFVRRVDQVIRCNSAVAVDLRRELRKALGLRPDQDAFEAFFVDPDFPERALPLLDDESIFVKRVLRPMMSKAGFDELLRREQVVNPKELVAYWLNVCLGDKEPPGDSLMKRQIGEVAAAATDLRFDFIAEHFSLIPVLERTRTCWNDRRRNLVRQRDKFDAINARFKRFFGIPMPADVEEELPSAEDMLWSMASALGQACQPFWLLKGGGEQRARVTVILPGGVEKRNPNDQQGINYIVPEVAGGFEGNPFVIMAYSSAGVDSIDEITSLDYFGDVESDLKLLERSHEDTEAAARFNRKRVGYAAPVYLNEEALRKNRWRPWVDVSAESLATLDLLAALEHAIFDYPNGLEDDIRNKMEELGWTFPLVRTGQNQWMQFTRRARRLSAQGVGAKSEEDVMGSAWSIGTNIVQGLVRFRQHLEDKPEYVQALVKERKSFERMFEHHLGKATWNRVVEARIRALDDQARIIAREDTETAGCLNDLKKYLSGQLAQRE